MTAESAGHDQFNWSVVQHNLDQCWRCLWVDVPNVVACPTFQIEILRDCDSTAVQNFDFSIDGWMAITTVDNGPVLETAIFATCRWQEISLNTLIWWTYWKAEILTLVFYKHVLKSTTTTASESGSSSVKLTVLNLILKFWTTVLVYFVLVHLQFFYADIWCKVTVDVLLWHSIGLLVHSGFLDPVLWLTCGFHCYLCGQSEIVCDTKQYTMCVSTCVLCEFNIQYYSCLAAHGCVMSLSLSEMKQNFCLLSFNTVFLRRVLACGQFATRQTIGLASECFLCCIIHIDTYVFWHLFALF